MELKKDVKALDHYYYYVEDTDTSYVITAIETIERVSNAVFYVLTPVYGPATREYNVMVAYYESFNDALARGHIYRLEDVDDILYQWENPVSY